MWYEKRVTGKLRVVGRLQSSKNGNPRFLVEIDGHGIYRTRPDSGLAYSIQNHDGRVVTATVGEHYGKMVIANIED